MLAGRLAGFQHSAYTARVGFYPTATVFMNALSQKVQTLGERGVKWQVLKIINFLALLCEEGWIFI